MRLGSRASMVQRVLTSVVVRLGHIPTGLKAPAIVQPKGLPSAEQVRNEIGERWWRWMRSSRSARRASEAGSTCSTIRFWAL